MCCDLCYSCERACYVKTCWSPCFWHSNVRSGSYATAVYTIALSFCVIVYTIYLMNGGDSSQVYLPFFEATLSSSTQSGGAFTIFYFLVFIIMSILLIIGVKMDIRGLMIPWMVGMLIMVLFQTCYGLNLIFSYYIYLECVFVAMINWAWMGYHCYCYSVVRSHYKNVKWFQSPDIQILDDYY